jgi:hypothetical protein
MRTTFTQPAQREILFARNGNVLLGGPVVIVQEGHTRVGVISTASAEESPDGSIRYSIDLWPPEPR